MLLNIVDWFDPTNIDHIKAYSYLQSKGMWPPGFLPEGIEIPQGWSIRIMDKIVEQYIREKLNDHN